MMGPEMIYLVTAIVVGGIVGWLAGLIKGFGFGLIWNMAIGVVGAFIGLWVIPRLGLAPTGDIIGGIIVSAIGAVVLVAIAGLIKRAM
jgi:uncharacterized membrane protein YeaQ/YmgE (transglycosylase-associated protein family)